MAEQEAKIIFRIDGDLKRAFEVLAAEKDQTTSQMLRAYIRYEVEKHLTKSQGDLFKTQSTPATKEPKKTPQSAKTKPTEGKKALLDMFKPKR